MSIRMILLEMINDKNYEPKTKEEFASYFQIGPKDRKSFYKILKDLENEALVIRNKQDKYVPSSEDFMLVGRLEGNEKGFGFLIPEDKERRDVFIPFEYMNGAFHGDKVLVNILKGQDGNKREEGEVVNILERNTKTIVGTFEDNKSFGFVIPDDHKISYDFFIPKSQTLKAKHNQKVLIEITAYPNKNKNPEARVIEVLGFPSEKGVDILSIAKEYHLPDEFPKEIRELAKSTAKEVSEEDKLNRVDLRDELIFTIDGFDAKDLDDAISIDRLDNGNIQLGVHIADVSHYVEERGAMDREAYERGNSAYLLDRVIPMLPEEISNGICSLNEGVDRLCLSVTMEISNTGSVVSHRIEETIINSKRRLVYDHVSNYLEDKSLVDSSIVGLEDKLVLMEELSSILYGRREKRGSIDFDFPETKIILDDKGKPVDVFKSERRIGNRIIEEFMLVCNETVAEQFYWAEIPFLYRIHEEPASEKIENFNKIIHNFGYSIKGKQEIHPKDLQILTKEIKGKKEETLISTLLLRSLRKAVYSNEPDIHFGLAAKYYSHFTAPIRRYPDLVIHRIIKKSISGNLSGKYIKFLEENLEEIADHTSMTERRAEEAEREVEDMKKAQYMTQYIGMEFNGVVSSVTGFGMFIQLDNTIEGLVHFNSMKDDYYDFDEENYYIIGERSKKIYRLGDEVRVLVTDANIYKRTIDFALSDL